MILIIMLLHIPLNVCQYKTFVLNFIQNNFRTILRSAVPWWSRKLLSILWHSDRKHTNTHQHPFMPSAAQLSGKLQNKWQPINCNETVNTVNERLHLCTICQTIWAQRWLKHGHLGSTALHFAPRSCYYTQCNQKYCFCSVQHVLLT